MDDKQMDELFNGAKPLDEMPPETELITDLTGFQVTSAMYFAHIKEPTLTMWKNRLKFNMACLRRFPNVTHIQLLIHPTQKRLIIRPCDPDAPDSLRWAKGGGEKELSNRDLMCKIFAAKVFDLMDWEEQYHYRLMGKPAVYKNEMLFLFKLAEFQFYLNGGKKKGPYLPGDWRDYFGIPVEKHEESYKIDLADGYITTDKA